MNYISLDLEFTSLNLEHSQILEFGAIIENTLNKLNFNDIPKFHCYIDHNIISGDPIALNMNKNIIQILAEYKKLNSKEKLNFLKTNNIKILKENELVPEFLKFLYLNKLTPYNNDNELNINKLPTVLDGILKTKLLLVGKNLQKNDLPLLNKIPNWLNCFNVSHRVLDPTPLFVDWYNDNDFPDLSKCKSRAILGIYRFKGSFSEAQAGGFP
jgi:hypothetical protein